jgi:hypothetical protein
LTTIRTLAASALLAAAPLAAHAADQFDLVCRGQVTQYDGATKPFETRLHIDLATRRICLDDCAAVGRLTEITDAALAGRYTDSGPFPNGIPGVFDYRSDLAVDRRTGAYRRTDTDDSGDPPPVNARVSTFVGRCEAAPYTGLAVRPG